MFRRKKQKVTFSDMSRLEEFGNAYSLLSSTIYDIMEKKEPAEIRQILETLKHINKKNCKYQIYRIREFIRYAGIEVLKKKTPQIKVMEEEQQEKIMTEKDMEQAK
jgi:hypothetical protein